PTLLPGGRPVTDQAARAEVEKAWSAPLPTGVGRDTTRIVEAAAIGELGGLLIGGVDPADLPHPAAALAAIETAGFVVSIELRATAVTERANVVFPAAAAAEKAGAYLDWEGRVRPFGAAIRKQGLLDDGRILDTLGVEMDVDLYTQSPAAAVAEIERLGQWQGSTTTALPTGPAPVDPNAGVDGGLLLGYWRMAIDGGSLLDGEPHLAGTAKAEVACVSAATALSAGLTDGEMVGVAGPAGSVAVLLRVIPDDKMVAGVVWLPGRVRGASTPATLGAAAGQRVSVSPVTWTAYPEETS
ncbi:MAG: NADH-quinone oxidoreductase subunit G, partial [Actinomycetota bacterium]|nr:NADH-quinone oxidoreductase subunit G [Actinomycetota bacterium]